jgi:hypothetical protein
MNNPFDAIGQENDKIDITLIPGLHSPDFDALSSRMSDHARC